ncbi:MAG: hypothetical protein IPM74_01240 [Crocinitomicaceae bacterium]|nr:hypothetical protein [Crocinitomicaceae bacterium]MBK8924541.1 hypothetical protein [Crocinitomicaceae bacterium]
MVMPGRNATNANYRFSFQGQEKDNEIKGDNNSINYKYRMHDPRIGRFFAVDPLAAKYPHYSPYLFSGNRVIDSRELEGLEPVTDPTSVPEGTFLYAPLQGQFHNRLWTNISGQWLITAAPVEVLSNWDYNARRMRYLETRDHPSIISYLNATNGYHDYVSGLQKSGDWKKLTEGQRNNILFQYTRDQNRDAYENMGRGILMIIGAPAIMVTAAVALPAIFEIGAYGAYGAYVGGTYVATYTPMLVSRYAQWQISNWKINAVTSTFNIIYQGWTTGKVDLIQPITQMVSPHWSITAPIDAAFDWNLSSNGLKMEIAGTKDKSWGEFYAQLGTGAFLGYTGTAFGSSDITNPFYWSYQLAGHGIGTGIDYSLGGKNKFSWQQ